MSRTLICVMMALLLNSSIMGETKTDNSYYYSDFSSAEQLLKIVRIYLEAAASNDYSAMKQFADPDTSLDHFAVHRNGHYYDSSGKELVQYWYVRDLLRRKNENAYDIYVECYIPSDGGYQTSGAHAVAKWRHGRYVLTEW